LNSLVYFGIGFGEAKSQNLLVAMIGIKYAARNSGDFMCDGQMLSEFNVTR
jgi:hypothetical protein